MVPHPLAIFALGALFASGPLLAAQGPATVRGRFLTPGGEPLAGVHVSVAEERIEPGGRDADEIHEPWVGPAVDSGDDGTFALVFVPPEGFTLTLRANRDDLAPASWKLRKVTAGRVIEVEDAVLHPCGDLIGRLVGEDDRPLPGSWTVGVFPAVEWLPPRHTLASRRIPVDPKTGVFRFDSLPAVKMKLVATAPQWWRVDGPAVQVRAGETVEVLLRSDASNTVGGIRVTATCPLGTIRDLGHLRLVASDGDELALTERFLPRRPLLFIEVAPGDYALEINDPRFEPLRKEGVRPGEEVQVELVGSAALKMNVFDATTQERLIGFHLEVIVEDSEIHRRGAPVRLWDQPPFDDVIPGIVPGDLHVTVVMPRRRSEVVRVPAVAPGETREVDVWMRNAPLVRGIVRDLNGRPVPGARVGLLEPARVDDSPTSPVRDRMRGVTHGEEGLEEYRMRVGQGRTDGDGGFTFATVPPGEYFVQAEVEGAEPVASNLFTLTQRNTVDGIVLELGIRSATLVVQLDGLADVDLDETTDEMLILAVRVYEPRAEESEEAPKLLGSDETWIDPEWIDPLVLGPLPAGEIVVDLRLSPGYRRSAGGFVSGRGGHRTLGTVDASAGGELEVTFSLTDFVPGHVSVRLREDGNPLPGCEVHVVGAAAEVVEARVDTTDAEGRVRIGPLFPGEWHVLVRDRRRGWDHLLPGPFLLPPGGEIPLDVVVQLVPGELTCLDHDTGEPWRDTAFEYLPFLPGVFTHQIRHWSHVRTDPRGRLHLSLLPGTYRLRRILDKPLTGPWSEEASFAWTRAGPASSELRLR